MDDVRVRIYKREFIVHHHRDTFAYATSDKVVYVRQFELTSEKMVLVASLLGHQEEITQVGTS